MKKNSEQWLKLALKVGQSYASQIRSDRTTNIDRSIMVQCVKTLLTGVALSSAQRDSFLESIRRRVGGQYIDRQFPDRVILTKRQRLAARNNKGRILSDLGNCYQHDFGSGFQLATAVALDRNDSATILSPRCNRDAPNLHPACDRDVTYLSPTCDKRSENIRDTNTLGVPTERNGTEQNDTERMAEMDLRSTRARLGLPPRSRVASPADEVALVTPPEHPGSPAGSPVVSALCSEGDVASHLSSRELTAALSAVAPAEREAECEQHAGWTSPRSTGRWSEWELAGATYGRGQEPPQTELEAEPPKALTHDIAPGLDVSRGFKVEVSLWANNSSLSGELKVNGETYHVNFEGYTRCEELLSRSHRRDDDQMNHAWLSGHMWRTLGQPYRDSQSRTIGNADPAERFAVSGLYDNRGHSGRPVPRVMARACWRGNQLTAVELYNGTDVVHQKMKAYTGSNPKAPTYKSA